MEFGTKPECIPIFSHLVYWITSCNKSFKGWPFWSLHSNVEFEENFPPKNLDDLAKLTENTEFDTRHGFFYFKGVGVQGPFVLTYFRYEPFFNYRWTVDGTLPTGPVTTRNTGSFNTCNPTATTNDCVVSALLDNYTINPLVAGLHKYFFPWCPSFLENPLELVIYFFENISPVHTYSKWWWYWVKEIHFLPRRTWNGKYLGRVYGWACC